MAPRRHAGSAAAPPPLTAESVALAGGTYTLPGILITSRFDNDIGLVG